MVLTQLSVATSVMMDSGSNPGADPMNKISCVKIYGALVWSAKFGWKFLSKLKKRNWKRWNVAQSPVGKDLRFACQAQAAISKSKQTYFNQFRL